ncbi:hypothetical protein LBMAG53_23560 [Planctomycetota bacterium]|nr:hypothetical protein LBMAG53_23560 [Planctomycetota bacterium]
MRRTKQPLPDVITKYDIWVMVMGWLWTFYGVILTLVCLAGLVMMPRMIVKAINNQPRTVDQTSIFTLEAGDVARMSGTIIGNKVIDFETRILKTEYSLALVENTGNRVVIFQKGLLSKQEKTTPLPREYVGELHFTNSGSLRIHKHTIDVVRQFRQMDLDIPDRLAVIAVDDIPQLSVIHIIMFLLCALGVGYVAYKVKTAIFYMRHEKLFVEHLAAKYGSR